MPTTKAHGAIRKKEFEVQRKKDIRTIRRWLEEGTIKSWQDVFEIMPMSRVSLTIGIAYNPFLMRIKYPEKFSIAEMQEIAKAFGCGYEAVHHFIYYKLVRKKKR